MADGIEITLHFLFYYGCQQKKSDEVGDGHGEDHGVGKVYDVLEAGGGAYDDESAEEQLVGQVGHFAAAEEVHPGLQAVVRPGDHGGEGEEDDCHGEHVGEPRQYRLEGFGGEGYAVAGGVVVSTRNDDDEGCHGADDHGVYEGAHLGYIAFAGGVVGAHGRVGDGCRAYAGFVGEGRTPEALDEDAHKPSCYAHGGEGLGEYFAKSGRDACIVDDQYDDGGQQVDAHHKGDNFLRNLADALDAANDDEGYENSDDQAKEKTRVAGGGSNQVIELLGGLIGLKHVAAAKRAAYTHDGEKCSQDFPQAGEIAGFEALAEIVHGAAVNGAVGPHIAVFYAEGTLHKLGRHAEEAGDDHPESGARPAERDGHGHAGDVAQAHRAGERCRKGLKMRDLTLIFNFAVGAFDRLHRSAETADVDKFEVKGEKGGCQQQKDDDQGHSHGVFRIIKVLGIKYCQGNGLGIGFYPFVDAFVQAFGGLFLDFLCKRNQRQQHQEQCIEKARCFHMFCVL